MREKASAEDIDRVLALVAMAWKKYPHQRLGQLLLNLYGTKKKAEVLWNMDEQELITELEDLLKHGW